MARHHYVRRIGAGEANFHGYGQDRVDHLLGRVEVRPPGETPAILEFADAVLVPAYDGLYDLEGRLIEQTKATWLDPDVPEVSSQIAKLTAKEAKRSPPRIEPPAVLETVEEPVVMLGKLHPHYGHFLTDSMARFWALGRLDPALKVVFAPSEPATREIPYVRWMLERLGLGPSRILTPAGPTLLRRVICPMPAFQLSRRAFAGFDAPHLQVAAQVMAEAPPTWTGKRVYLTRSGFSGGLRSVSGEEPVEARVRRERYVVVRPESLSLQEQIILFNQADRIVGAQGSALHTALFRLPGSPPLRIGALCGPVLQGRYMLQDGIKGLRMSYLRCLDELPAPPGSRYDPPLVVDADRTADLLKRAGFFKGRA